MSLTAITIHNQYSEIQKLWEDYLADGVEHICSTEEFVPCHVCQRSQEAADMLQGKALQMAELVLSYHKLLRELSMQVVQNVPGENRPPELQMAMLRGIAATGD